MSAALLVDSVWKVELEKKDVLSQVKKFKLLSRGPHSHIHVKQAGKFLIETVPLCPARDVRDRRTKNLIMTASPHLCGTPYYGEGTLGTQCSFRKVPTEIERKNRLTLTTSSTGEVVETEVHEMEIAPDKEDRVRPLLKQLSEVRSHFPTLDLPEGTEYVSFECEETEDGVVGLGLCSENVLMFEEVLEYDDEDNILMDDETRARKAALKSQKTKRLDKKSKREKPQRLEDEEDDDKKKSKCVRVYQGMWIEARSCFSGQWWVQAASQNAFINPFASSPVLKDTVKGQVFTMQLSSQFDKVAGIKAKKERKAARDKGYMCPVCGEVFAVCAQLTTHKRKSGHGASQCQVCSEWIPSRCAMKKHKKRQGHELFVGQAVANKLCRSSVQNEQRKRKREEVISEEEAIQSKVEKKRHFAVIYGLPLVEKDILPAAASSSSSSSSLNVPSSSSSAVSSHSLSIQEFPPSSSTTLSPLPAPSSSSSHPPSPSISSSSSSSFTDTATTTRISRYDKLIKVLHKVGVFREATPIEGSIEMPMADAGSDGSPARSRGFMFVEFSSSKELDQLVLSMAEGLRLDKNHTLFCKAAADVQLNDEYCESFNRWMRSRQVVGGGVDWLPAFETPREDTFFMDSSFRKNIPEKPAKQITSWFANPFASDYASSMGVSHLLAPPEIDEEKKRQEEEEAAERERAKKSKTTVKRAKAVEPVRVKIVHFASNPSNLDTLLKLTKDSKAHSPASDRVLRMTEDLLKQIEASNVQLGVKAEEKHTMFVAQVWLARAQAMLGLGAFANCLACTDKGSGMLDTYPVPEATELSLEIVELAEEARKGLGVGLSAPTGVTARFLLEYTLAHCPLSDNDEEGRISKTWLTQQVVDAFILPDTKALGLSYVNSFVGPQFGASSMFVSHAWGASWMSLVQACVVEQVSGAASKSLQKDKLVVGAFEKDENSAATQLYEKTSSIAIRKQCEAMLEALRVCSLPTMYFWVDVFCKNQHLISSEDTATELSSQIKGAGQMMLVLQPLNSPVSLSRVWCLFEVLTCINCKTDMSVALSFDGMREMDDVIMGTRKQLVSSKVDDPMLASLVEQRKELKETILVESAGAAVAADKVMIMDLVDGTVGISRMNDLVRRAVDGSVLAWQVSTIRHWARQRKSRKWEKRVENMENLRKEYEAAEKAMSTRSK